MGDYGDSSSSAGTYPLGNSQGSSVGSSTGGSQFTSNYGDTSAGSYGQFGNSESSDYGVGGTGSYPYGSSQGFGNSLPSGPSAESEARVPNSYANVGVESASSTSDNTYSSSYYLPGPAGSSDTIGSSSPNNYGYSENYGNTNQGGQEDVASPSSLYNYGSVGQDSSVGDTSSNPYLNNNYVSSPDDASNNPYLTNSGSALPGADVSESVYSFPTYPVAGSDNSNGDSGYGGQATNEQPAYGGYGVGESNTGDSVPPPIYPYNGGQGIPSNPSSGESYGYGSQSGNPTNGETSNWGTADTSVGSVGSSNGWGGYYENQGADETGNNSPYSYTLPIYNPSEGDASNSSSSGDSGNSSPYVLPFNPNSNGDVNDNNEDQWRPIGGDTYSENIPYNQPQESAQINQYSGGEVVQQESHQAAANQPSQGRRAAKHRGASKTKAKQSGLARNKKSIKRTRRSKMKNRN